MNDKITIKGLSVYAYHGALEEEKKIGQRFYIDANLYIATQKAGLTDNLENSVHYGEVAQKIIEQFTTHSFHLIEAAAEHIAISLLNRFLLLDKVEITVHKPSAPVPLTLESISLTICRQRHEAIIALGSNIGDRKGYLNSAIDALNKTQTCSVKKVSSFLETDPVSHIKQDKFLNAVLLLETYLCPHNLLSLLQDIERAHHRERSVRWGPRTLDLDIIFYDDMIYHDAALNIPHPLSHLRTFVMEPLAEIDPYRIHPRLQRSVVEILESLKNKEN